MTDSLRRAVDDYDREHNEPRVLRRLERRGGVRRICVACRAPFDHQEHYEAWCEQMRDAGWRERYDGRLNGRRWQWHRWVSDAVPVPYVFPTACPACGGELVEVVS